jgi:hypothetical protein
MARSIDGGQAGAALVFFSLDVEASRDGGIDAAD